MRIVDQVKVCFENLKLKRRVKQLELELDLTFKKLKREEDIIDMLEDQIKTMEDCMEKSDGPTRV